MRLSSVLFVFYIFRYVSVLQRLKRRRHLKIRAAALCNFSVLKIYLLVFCGRITYQSGRIEIFAMHINSRNLMIVIRCVIVNSLICIATRCVKRNLVFAAFKLAATPWLAYRIQNMEKLTYAFFFAVLGQRICLDERRSDKPRLRREISGESERAHTARISREIYIGSKCVIRVGRDEALIVV